MPKVPEGDAGRVSRREFVQRAARRANLPLATMQAAYDAMIEELVEQVSQGNRVTLTGFGKFYPQLHKGHRVRRAGGVYEEIPEYLVLKFSAVKDVNEQLKERATERTVNPPAFPAPDSGYKKVASPEELELADDLRAQQWPEP